MKRLPRRRPTRVTPELLAQIQELIERTTLTQDEIAMHVGCSQATVSRLSVYQA